MTKAHRTRQFIINKTAPVFNRRGYAATSLQELTKATKLTKGALYGNFTNKEEIATAVFHYSMEKMRDAVFQALADAGTSREKLEYFLGFYEKYVFDTPVPGGCPFMNNAVEADDHNLFLKKAVAAEGERIVTFLATLFEQGKQRGEFKATIKSDELALFFFCSVEGAIVISRVSSTSLPMKAVVNQCKNILKQISL